MGNFVVKKIVEFFGIMMFLCGAVFADIPDAKRPKSPDKEKVEAAANRDESEKTVSEYKDTLTYGIPSEVSALVDKLISNEDPRFSDDLYDLFQYSRNPDIREKILSYFAKIEDPCLEDFAVTVLEDPFDEKYSTVKMCFQYVSAVKCSEAAPAVMRLIENEDEKYFNDALLCIGEIGGADEALAMSEYIDKTDLTDAQKQSLMRALGKIGAVETWNKLVEIARSEDENLFVRMYATESIGAMKKKESIPVLIDVLGESDPNLRQYAVKGLSYFPDVLEAKSAVLDAIRDNHVKVRLEAISVAKKNEMTDAVPYLIHRAKNDSEAKVKQDSYAALAHLNTKDGNDFLIERLGDKKTGDALRTRAVEVLLKEGNAGVDEIKEFVLKVAVDDTKKPLRTSLGKLISKYPNPEFGEICIKYLESKDAGTQGLGLDMYQNGKYKEAIPYLQRIVDNKKSNSANKRRAERLLGVEDEESEPKKSKEEPKSDGLAKSDETSEDLETSEDSGNVENAENAE